MKFRYATLAAALIAGGFATNASAASPATGTFTVTLVVNKTCVVNTTGASNITLGPVNAGGTTTTQSGTFTVNCAKTVPFYVGLAPSNANTAGLGVLTSGANTIAYQLYQNSGGTTIWGNTATSTSAGNGESGTGGGMATGAVSFTAYANATGSTDVAPGTYTDTVTINVNY